MIHIDRDIRLNVDKVNDKIIDDLAKAQDAVKKVADKAANPFMGMIKICCTIAIFGGLVYLLYMFLPLN